MIPILQDNLVEGTEYFYVILSTNESAVTFNETTLRVNIEDDDGM